MNVHFIDFLKTEEIVWREAPGEVNLRILTSSHTVQYIKWSLELSDALRGLSRLIFGVKASGSELPLLAKRERERTLGSWLQSEKT